MYPLMCSVFWQFLGTKSHGVSQFAIYILTKFSIHFSVVWFVVDVVQIQVGLGQLFTMMRINFMLVAQKHIIGGVRTHVTLVQFTLSLSQIVDICVMPINFWRHIWWIGTNGALNWHDDLDVTLVTPARNKPTIVQTCSTSMQCICILCAYTVFGVIVL